MARAHRGLLRIRPASSRDDLTQVRRLFRAYARGLKVDLAIDGFREEVRHLPGEYAPPTGRVFLADWRGEPGGCVAVRRIDRNTAELKRLYVARRLRGKGVGRSLVLRAVRAARSMGYRRIRLDTLPTMTAAQALYMSLGFRRIPAYRRSPFPGTRFYELRLAGDHRSAKPVRRRGRLTSS